MKSMKLIINYKNGNRIENIVHHVVFSNGKLHAIVATQIYGFNNNHFSVPLEIIESFSVEESEKKYQ